jgi:hypothetical protein
MTRLIVFAAFVCLATTASGQDRFTAEVEAEPPWQLRGADDEVNTFATFTYLVGRVRVAW